MSTTRDLYAKLDSGLIIPKRLVPEPAKPEPPAIPKELFAKFRRTEQKKLAAVGYDHRCACGKRISHNKQQCAVCSASRAVLSARAEAAGLVLPDGAK